MEENLNRRIANSYNQYFTYTNNSTFYVLAPVYLFDFYNQSVRTWDRWNSGWVENFHSVEDGILPTLFASSLCKKIADLIYGEGLYFESTDEKNIEGDSLDFISDIDKEIDIKGMIKDVIHKSVQLGNGLLKLNSGADNNLWIDSIAGNRFFVNLNSRGEVTKCMTWVNIYTNGVPEKGKEPDSYGLVELRYYDEDEDGNIVRVNGERVPMVVYKIYKLSGRANVFDSNAEDTSIRFNDLPRRVRREFREEYGDLELNEPQKLEGLKNLGVYLIKHTNYFSMMPNIKLGESCLAGIINYLPKYDAIDSEETIDLRISRPKVIVPDFMTKGKTVNEDPLNSYNDIIFAKVPNKSDKEQQPVVFMPTPREQHFIHMKEDVIKKICGNLGIATSSLFSDIADARGNVTATEIDSETSNTALYQTNKRKIILKPINDMINDILGYYGKEQNVKISFTQAGASNKSVTVKNTTALVNAGLESEYQAIKENHPDWTDQQVEEEIKEIHKADGSKASDVIENTKEKETTEIDGKIDKKEEVVKTKKDNTDK